MAREHLGIAATRSRTQNRAVREDFDLASPARRPIAARRRIENDDGVLHRSVVRRGFDLFFKVGLRNLPAVRKTARVLLIVLGAIVLFAVVILLAVNLYVQSQGTQARIQRELSQRLGTTLRLRRMSVTPWGGLKLSGITIPQVAEGPNAEFLDAKTFRLRIHFASLFSRRLVIKEISLIDPAVVWLQNADGKWRIPAGAPAKVGEPATSSTAVPVVSDSVAPASAPNPGSTEDRPSAAVSPAESERRESSFVPELRRVNLVGGHFQFLDAKAGVVAKFDDVQFHSNFRNTAAVKGSVSIAKTSLRDRFFLQRLQSRLEYGPAALEMTEVTAQAGGGDITGAFRMEPETQDSPFTAKVRFRDIQSDQIVSEAGGPAGVVSGKLEGFLDAAGKTADPNALTGAGEIHLRDGQVRRYSVLEALGQLLQIEELRQLRLDDAHVKYHLSPGVVTVDELTLRSANLRLSATGTIGFDGKLQLKSQLAVNERIRKQLFRAIRDNFQPIDEPGFTAVNFNIGGTVDRPNSNLMDKVVGRDLKDIGSVINSLFGGVKSERMKKKKAPASEASPSAPPEATATPSDIPPDAPQPTPSP